MIQFLNDWNGYDCWALANLGATEEARLIGLGLARAYPPSVASESLSVRTATASATANADGSETVQSSVSGYASASTTTPVSLTGTTATKPLLEYTIPRSQITPGKMFEITAVVSGASASAKTLQIVVNDGRGGWVGGNLIYSVGGVTINGTAFFKSYLSIRDDYTQLGGALNIVGGIGSSGNQPVLLNKNSLLGLDVCVISALSTASDYITLESFNIQG